jgi:hypothetical protein
MDEANASGSRARCWRRDVAQEVARVFDRFYKGSAWRSGPRLAIARDRRRSAAISASSESESGTTLEFTVPRSGFGGQLGRGRQAVSAGCAGGGDHDGRRGGSGSWLAIAAGSTAQAASNSQAQLRRIARRSTRCRIRSHTRARRSRVRRHGGRGAPRSSTSFARTSTDDLRAGPSTSPSRRSKRLPTRWTAPRRCGGSR